MMLDDIISWFKVLMFFLALFLWLSILITFIVISKKRNKRKGDNTYCLFNEHLREYEKFKLENGN